jgi:hypothetical protein
MSFLWTVEKTQIAIDLWNAGQSGGQIAKALNAPSRDSVTRKISRLRSQGLAIQSRPSPIRPKLVNIEAAMPVIRFVGPLGSDGPVSLVEAGFRQCRYPLWQGRSEPKLVCGKRTRSAKCSWCEEHYALIWRRSGRARSERSQKATGEHRDRQQTPGPQP